MCQQPQCQSVLCNVTSPQQPPEEGKTASHFQTEKQAICPTSNNSMASLLLDFHDGLCSVPSKDGQAPVLCSHSAVLLSKRHTHPTERSQVTTFSNFRDRNQTGSFPHCTQQEGT